jgi:hypothetical protein
MIGEKAGRYSLEDELMSFQNRFSSKLGLMLTEEMDRWIRRTRDMIAKDQSLRDTIYTNIQLFNQSRIFDRLLFDWKSKFNHMLNELLIVKGVIKSIECKQDLNDLVHEIDTRKREILFLSVLKK